VKKYPLIVFVLFLFILSACSSEATSIFVQETVTAVVTDSSLIKYYPLDTKTGNAEIDVILSAVASGKSQRLINLFGYTTATCKTVNALGGPPPCRKGEAEGTTVEVLPFLGSEGSYLWKDEIDNFSGLNVIGLYAVYQVSETAYSEANYPAGDYGIALVAKQNFSDVVLQVKNGMVVRIDYLFDNSFFETTLQRDASGFVLEPLK